MSDIVTDLWEFKYKPQTFDEIILDERIKPKLKKVLDEVPNMTIAGPAGVGKGTFMDVLKEERHPEIMKINGSDETGVDAIRDRVKPFAESMGFSDKLKIVYINEADRLSPNAQDMLRDLIENVHDLTRFILLCNYPERISPEIFSRCPLITIPNPPIKEIAKKCIDILKSEGVKYDGKAVINIVKSCYPDIRNTINTLKYNVVDGVLAEDAIIINIDQVYQDVVEAMKTSDPSQVRKVLRSNPIDYVKLYEYLYKLIMDSEESVFSNDISAILHITEGAYRNDRVAIKEISFMNMYLKLLKNGCI
jgi:DNA polymerase III delta prime subunit